MRFCSHCQRPLFVGARFCAHCGCPAEFLPPPQNAPTALPYSYPFAYGMPPRARRGGKGFAITGMILGILSVVVTSGAAGVGWSFGLIYAIVGLVFSILGMRRCARGVPGSGRGMAIAGLVCSIVGLCIGILYSLVTVLFILFAGDTMGMPDPRPMLRS